MAAKSAAFKRTSFLLEDNFLPLEERLHSRVWLAGLIFTGRIVFHL